MNSFYSDEELLDIGFMAVGTGTSISRKSSFYGISNIVIGKNVRIDDFCILSGNIVIGDNVHLAAGVYCFGGKTGIVLEDFVGVSSRSVIYAESDDYLGFALTNPTIPDEYKQIYCGKVILKKHVLIGTGCTILPGVEVGEGTAVGCMSFINKSLSPWGIYAGVPCKLIKSRSKNLLGKEKKYLLENP